jgi:hypothetical protein
VFVAILVIGSVDWIAWLALSSPSPAAAAVIGALSTLGLVLSGVLLRLTSVEDRADGSGAGRADAETTLGRDSLPSTQPAEDD